MFAAEKQRSLTSKKNLSQEAPVMLEVRSRAKNTRKEPPLSSTRKGFSFAPPQEGIYGRKKGMARVLSPLMTLGRKMYGLALVFFSIFLTLSFVTYEPSDPSWNTVVHGPIQNLGGTWGAIFADWSIQFFGACSFFLVAVLFLQGLRIFLSKNPVSFVKGLLWILILQILVSVGAALWDPHAYSTSGSLGFLLHRHLLAIFQKSGFPYPYPVLAVVISFLGLFSFKQAFFMTFREGRTALQTAYDHLGSLCVGLKRLLSFALKGVKTGHIWASSFKGSYGSSVSDSQQSAFEHWENRIENAAPKGTRKKEDHRPQIELPQREQGPDEANLGILSEDVDAHSKESPVPFFSGSYQEETTAPSSPDEAAPSLFSPASRLLKIMGSGKEGKEHASLKTAVSQSELPLECTYQLPSLGLLTPPVKEGEPLRETESLLADNAQNLMDVLEDFGIRGEITKVRPGPVVTLYEFVPAPGIKASRIIGLADDIARSMSALSARIAVIPGHNALGIELPNKNRQTVYLRGLLSSHDYESSGPSLPLALGKDISGEPVISDLARMPHLLVAGTTGSGKSVAINTMILSLLYRLSPNHCRFIMIDPKMLELSMYNGIPHLLSPVVTDPKKAIFALKWTVKEMEDRYRAMSKLGVRNIEGYNARLSQALAQNEKLTCDVQTGFDPESGRPIFETQPLDMTPFPYIVVVVDEMADLMLVAGKEIEATVQRLAQMARAAGIHLIMATQRPSVDVITGTIKANFPTRISFQVTSRFDSRTILGEQGAEQLLGRGDMLYMECGGKIQRVHGPFVSDQEVERVVNALKTQGEPHYIETITEEDTDISAGSFGATTGGDKEDALYQQAVQLIRRERKASTSFIQRHLRIGYNTAARLIEQMETQGIVSQANHVGKREVLLPED